MANFYSHVDNNCGIIAVRLVNLWGLFGPFSVCVCVRACACYTYCFTGHTVNAMQLNQIEPMRNMLAFYGAVFYQRKVFLHPQL